MRGGAIIAEAIAERIGPAEPLPPDDPKSALAAFTVPGQAEAISAEIDRDLDAPGVHDMTAKYGKRLVNRDWLLSEGDTIRISKLGGAA